MSQVWEEQESALREYCGAKTVAELLTVIQSLQVSGGLEELSRQLLAAAPPPSPLTEEEAWAAWLMLSALRKEGSALSPSQNLPPENVNLAKLFEHLAPLTDCAVGKVQDSTQEASGRLGAKIGVSRQAKFSDLGGSIAAGTGQSSYALIDSLILRGSLTITPTYRLSSALRRYPLGWVGKAGLEVNTRLLLRDINYLFGSSPASLPGVSRATVRVGTMDYSKALRLGFLMVTRDFSAFASGTGDYIARLSRTGMAGSLNLPNLSEALTFSEKLPIDLIQRGLVIRAK